MGITILGKTFPYDLKRNPEVSNPKTHTLTILDCLKQSRFWELMEILDSYGTKATVGHIMGNPTWIKNYLDTLPNYELPKLIGETDPEGDFRKQIVARLGEKG